MSVLPLNTSSYQILLVEEAEAVYPDRASIARVYYLWRHNY